MSLNDDRVADEVAKSAPDGHQTRKRNGKKTKKKETTDEALKSLTILCDDTIRRILSFMSVQQRVRLSRTSKIIRFVVLESLLSVHLFYSRSPFEWSFKGEKTDSRLKTLARMKNLRSMNISLNSGIENWEKVVEVLVDNCQYLEHFRNWDMECVDAYISGLLAKGVPVRLKTIHLPYGKPSHHLLSILQKSSANLILYATDFYSNLSSVPGIHSRVHELVNGMRPFRPEKQSIFGLSNMRKLTGISCDGIHFKLILNSMPHLTHIGIRPSGNDEELLRILSEAKQDFTSIEYQSHYVDTKSIINMMEKKGQKLTFVRLRLYWEPIDVFELLIKCCPRLTGCNVYHCGDDLHFYYSNRELTIRKAMLEISLLPLLNLFPKVRTIYFGVGGSRVTHRYLPVTWKQEMRDFANKRKRCCLNVRCSGDWYYDHYDQNLHYL